MTQLLAAMKDKGATPYIAVILTAVLTFLTTLAFSIEATAQAAHKGTLVNAVVIEEHKALADDRYDNLRHVLYGVDKRQMRIENKIDKLIMSR
jgi:hypothetical protein